MDATIGVVGKLVLRIVVTRQGGIARMAIHRQYALGGRACHVRQLAAYRHFGTDALGIVGREADDDA